MKIINHSSFSILMLAICITIANISNLMAQVSPPDAVNILDELKDLHRIVENQNEDPWKLLPVLIPSLVALVVAIGGWILTYKILKRNIEEQERSSKETHLHQKDERIATSLFNSLQWFEGRTQKRSIGISIVDAQWNNFEELREVWTSVLVNQAIYLSTQSNAKDRLDEIANFDFIVEILKTKAEHLITMDQYNRLVGAFKKKQSGITRGVTIDPSRLIKLIEEFSSMQMARFPQRTTSPFVCLEKRPFLV